MAKALITQIAKRKMIQARNGEITLPPIAGIAIGDGANAELGETDDQLKNELLRKEYSECKKKTDTCYTYRIELGGSELVGKTINEVALYDAEGDILAIRVFKGLPKEEEMEMAFEFDDKF